MTDSELSLLSRGLSFSPTYHFDIFNTILDTNRFVRNLLLRKHFQQGIDEQVGDPLTSEMVSESDQNQSTVEQDVCPHVSFMFQDLSASLTLEQLYSESHMGSYGASCSTSQYGD